MSLEDYKLMQKKKRFGDNFESEFSLRESPRHVKLQKFDEFDFEVKLDQQGIRMDDLISSYRAGLNNKIDKLTGEKYRLEICKRYGITST